MGFALNYAITAAQPMMSESYPTEFRNSGVGHHRGAQENRPVSFRLLFWAA